MTKLRLEPLADRITPATVSGTTGDDLFLLFGIKAEGKSLEDIAEPLTAAK